MLFLLNDVVLNLSGVKLSPQMAARRFQSLPFEAVGKLGRELFAENPLLHLNRQERACRLATLIIAKAPRVNAALFVSPSYGCDPEEVMFRVATLGANVMAGLSHRQDEGLLDTLSTDREVWRRLAA
ncbi:hypothetical protein [Phenylobacterium sp.]|uniref:hypothetical protein n=1 Tax=Phenylobacterium sp. TaxID=1871053 RepID=UPI00286B6C68|nr:hypothetical protein [Phenylobacterium sp.]